MIKIHQIKQYGGDQVELRQQHFPELWLVEKRSSLGEPDRVNANECHCGAEIGNDVGLHEVTPLLRWRELI